MDTTVNSSVYASLLRSCGTVKALWDGRRVHAHIIRAGYDRDRFVNNLLVQMYGKCGCLEDARWVFDKIRQPNQFSWNIMIRAYAQNGFVEEAKWVFDRMPQRDVVSWTAMISAHARNGYGKEAFRFFGQMQLEGVEPDKVTFLSILDVCASLGDLAQGRKSHASIIHRGFELDDVVGTALVNMYGKCGSPDDARRVFDKMSQRDAVTWTAMIAAYSQNGCSKEALELFRQMQWKGVAPDKITFICIVDACACLAALAEGKESHASIIDSGLESDLVVGTALVSMYGKCGNLDDSKAVFDKMPQRNVYSWNSMIAAYTRNGHGKEALELFQKMQQKGMDADKITFICILDACTKMAALSQGMECHARIIGNGFETDVVVGTALVYMYGKCGRLDDARTVFHKMPQRNVVSWNAMISTYSQNGHGTEALQLFRQLQMNGIEPNQITFITVLDACAGLGALEEGKESHARIIDSGIDSDVIVGTALVNMYGKCCNPDDAKYVFDKIPQRNVYSWNSMIAAYSRNGRDKDGLELFQQMELNGMVPDKITYIGILDVCSCLAALAQGKESHGKIIYSGFETDVVVGTALIHMYGKCGSVDDARLVFDKMPQHDTVSWTAMITAYSQNGHGKQALELFRQMQLKDIAPDKITFISILSGCSHAGLLDDGWHFFVSMRRDYSIMPMVEHFVCMIDLLGRAGQLDEAEDLVNSMPFGPFSASWISFLGACRMHGDVERGTRAADNIFELDPRNPAPFVLLSNMYAAAGKWKAAAKVREAMKDRGVKKKPGCSCIEVRRRVYEFVVGDTSHPQKDEIYAELQRLSREMEKAGYHSDTKAVLHYAAEVNKEHLLCHHSEKLAIAFGLISTLPGTPLHITKNLRVCSDCHSATKFISNIVRRKIIVRDVNRFHHFENGVCSCGDYW